MVYFSSLVNKSGLIVDQSSIVGRFGFSLHREVLNKFCNSLYNYYMNNGYKRLCVGIDGTSCVSSILYDILIPNLKNTGLVSCIPEKPSTLPQFMWFCKESPNKSLGVYFKAINIDEHIEIVLIEGDKLLPPKNIKQLLKTTTILKINTLQGYEEDDQEFFNIDGYSKYLFDTKLVTPYPATINIDTMFGSSYYLLKELKKQQGLSIGLHNLQIEPPRFKNYISKPTGQFLRWHTTLSSVKPDQYFFALDSAGLNLGVFDLKQNIEISSAGIGILLVKYLKDIQKLTSATIAISTTVNSRLLKYIKKIGYTCLRVSGGLNEITTILDKKKIDLFVDEQGGYYFGTDSVRCFNPLIAIFKLVELSIKEQKSFGEMLDVINSSLLKDIIYHNNFFLASNFISIEEIVNKLSLDPDLKRAKYTKQVTSVLFKDKSKVHIKNNRKETILEIFIESYSGDRAIALGSSILDLLKEKTHETI